MRRENIWLRREQAAKERGHRAAASRRRRAKSQAHRRRLAAAYVAGREDGGTRLGGDSGHQRAQRINISAACA